MLHWLYHLVPTDHVPLNDVYAPESLEREGFVHTSYARDLAESARLYYPSTDNLSVLKIDPRRLDVPLVEAPTPRGPMPHVHGRIPADAIRDVRTFRELPRRDADVLDLEHSVLGTRIGFVAFRGMTLLDLVGVLDPLTRIASMGFDATTTCEVVSADDASVHREAGATLTVARVRPPLDEFDLVVVPGGRGARSLLEDENVLRWLQTYPANRWMASVCTGALLLGAIGRIRGRNATTHASELARLGEFGAIASTERVVRDAHIFTAGGVTSGIDLGIRLVRELCGDDFVNRVVRQMEWDRR